MNVGKFMSYVKEDENGCWLWQKCKRPNGYGWSYFDGKSITSNRLAWRIFVGEIPAGMYVLHKCDVRACCNPDHLFLGTHRDNMADMAAKGRSRKGQKGVVCNAKLSHENVQFIKSNFGKMTHQKLAEMFGVSRASISMIHTKRTWNV